MSVADDELVRVAAVVARLDEMEKRLDERFEAHDRALLGEVRRLSEHMAAQRDQINSALAASQRAVDKAEESAAERMKSHNGLIEQMQALSATFATRKEADDKLGALSHRLGRLENFQAKIIGALGVVGFSSTVLGIVSLIITLGH